MLYNNTYAGRLRFDNVIDNSHATNEYSINVRNEIINDNLPIYNLPKVKKSQ